MPETSYAKRERQRRRKKMLRMVLKWTIRLLVVCCLAMAVFWSLHETDKTVADAVIEETLSMGDYEHAAEMIKNSPATRLRKFLYDTLALKANFGLVKFDASLLRRDDQDHAILYAEDRYSFEIGLRDTSFLYLLQKRSDGRWELLFPNIRFSNKLLPLPPGLVAIPDAPLALSIDDRVEGVEIIYLVAYRWRPAVLESLIKAMADVQVDRSGWAGELEEFLRRQKSARDRFPGVVYREIEFIHK